MEENKKMDTEPVINLDNNIKNNVEEPKEESVVNQPIEIPRMDEPIVEDPNKDGIENPIVEPTPEVSEPVDAPPVEVDTMEDVIIDNSMEDVAVSESTPQESKEETVEAPKVESDTIEEPVIEKPTNPIPEVPTEKIEEPVSNPVAVTPVVEAETIEEPAPEANVAEEKVSEESQTLTEEIKEESQVVNSEPEPTAVPAEPAPVEPTPAVAPQESNPPSVENEITPGPTPNEPPKDLIQTPEPQIVGKLKKPGEKGLIIVAIMVLLLVLVVWQLPNIKEYFETGKLPWEKETPKPTTPAKEETPQDKDEEGFILVGGTANYSDENIKLSKFEVAEDELLVNLTLVDPNFDLTTVNYEIQVYNKEKTQVDRIDLETTKKLSTEEATTIKFSLADSSLAFYVKVVPNEVEIVMPDVELTNNTLTCKAENVTISYTFEENNLTTMSFTYDYTNTDAAVLATEAERFKAMQAIEENGVIKKIISGSTQFIYTERYDLDVYVPGTTKPDYYFAKGTPAKEINYTNEKNSYNCE